MEDRVLLFVPTARDGETTRSLLVQSGLECHICPSLADLAEQLRTGAAAILLTDEAISSERIEYLLDRLRQQPPWSDIPILMLMRGGVQSPAAGRVLHALGNVTLLERPAPMRSVLSAVQAAVRARRRQYQIREQIELISQSKRELDETIRQLNQAQASERAARLEAERVSSLKDEFLATLSHELRTPLNAIFGWTQLIRRDRSDPETVEQGIEVIDRNIRLQTQLIEDLLDVSRIISGKVRLDLQPVDVAKLIRDAANGVEPAARAKDVRLEVSADADVGQILADPARLQQVLWNLLSNAVKFTPGGGKIEVSAERDQRQVQMRVSDTGEGISPEFLPHLFERFRQADGSSRRRHGGLGLGLSIVKSLVELHGGTVQARSAGLGLGAQFLIQLPAPTVQREKIVVASSGPVRRPVELPSLQGIKVLVVDDEPDARELLRRIVRSQDAQPLLASSAAEARSLVSSFQPDVILSDIGMPGEDGYDFLRDIRRRGVKTPAVALTAFARAEDRARSLEAGYQRHLPKPVEAGELLAVIASLAGRLPDPVHSHRPVRSAARSEGES